MLSSCTTLATLGASLLVLLVLQNYSGLLSSFAELNKNYVKIKPMKGSFVYMIVLFHKYEWV